MTIEPEEPNTANLAGRVLQWLQGEGYPLEFRTAQILRESGFAARQGKHYRAGSDGPREIDVVGEFCHEQSDTFIRVSHYIECKWSKGYPWVVFSSEQASIAPSACVAQTQGNDLARAILWSLAGDKALHDTSIFSAPRRVGFGGRQAFTKSKDQFYAALQGIVGATQSEVDETSTPELGLLRELKYAEVGLPLVVVEGDLFEAYWDKSIQGMKVEPRGHIRLHWQGSAAWRLRASVDIVTIDSLAEFMTKRKAEIGVLLPKMFGTAAEIRECIRKQSLDPLTVTKGGRGFTGLPALLGRVRQSIQAPSTKSEDAHLSQSAEKLPRTDSASSAGE